MSKILLVEPDALIAKNLSLALKKAGHKVDWQRSGQAAISAVDKNTPDLIITELQLTAHSGIEFLYELRSYEEWQDLPLVIYSHLRNLDPTMQSWSRFNVINYHYKPETKLSDIVRSVDQALLAA